MKDSRLRRTICHASLLLALGATSACESPQPPPSRQRQPLTPKTNDTISGPRTTQHWAGQTRPSALPTDVSDNGIIHHFRVSLPRSWQDSRAEGMGLQEGVKLERFVVRLPSGNQQSVTEHATRSNGQLSYTHPESGTMVASMCAHGPDAHPMTYCLKRVYEAGNASAAALASPTNRFGDPAELRPLIPPEKVIPGSDLPVKVYMGHQPAQGLRVYAFAPDGRVIERETQASGIVDIPIDSHGDWKLRVATTLHEQPFVAELEFSNFKGGR